LVNAPLHPANKAVLQAASVIGRRFSPRLLAAITDVAVNDSLAATTALDLVRCGDRSESYAFTHALVCLQWHRQET
jgi:predicted ATPase